MKTVVKFEGSELCKAYSLPIESFIHRHFPQTIDSTVDVSEIILKIIMGSREVRQGSIPNVESQYSILQIIKSAIENDVAIPVLVGAGTKKPKNNESIDIAELSALKVLSTLNEQVCVYHKKGLSIVIRLEDLTGRMLETENQFDSMDKYVFDFKKLVKILEYDNFITIKAESDMVNLEDFRKKFQTFLPKFSNYISCGNTQNKKALDEIGWRGEIPEIMRKYYYERYEHSYPNRDQVFYEIMLSKYFAATMARHYLKATGDQNNSIQISFVPPTPGVPTGLHTPRVYYCTTFMKQTKMHVPFWRAKGFLKIEESGDVKIGLTSWLNIPDELEKGVLHIYNEEHEVYIQADFLLCE